MNLRLALADRYLPPFIRRAKLIELLHYAALAFRADPPAVAQRSFDDLLRQFAEFTAEHAEYCLGAVGDLHDTKRRLHEHAFTFGSGLRRWLKPRTRVEFMTALRLVYRTIGIDLEGESTGHIRVKHCYFSRHYSAEVCGVMAAMDAGVAAGLWGDGDLNFTHRLTEGHDSCEARFAFHEVLK